MLRGDRRGMLAAMRVASRVRRVDFDGQRARRREAGGRPWRDCPRAPRERQIAGRARGSANAAAFGRRTRRAGAQRLPHPRHSRRERKTAEAPRRSTRAVLSFSLLPEAGPRVREQPSLPRRRSQVRYPATPHDAAPPPRRRSSADDGDAKTCATHRPRAVSRLVCRTVRVEIHRAQLPQALGDLRFESAFCVGRYQACCGTPGGR